MNYFSEFRDTNLAKNIIENINKVSTKPVKLMEVCGGHTMAIHKNGIPSLLPENIELISGPGCPVCVTSRQFIDKAVAYAKIKNTIITTYGDLIRVPGSSSNLDEEKARGADIRIIYSTMDVIKTAVENPDKSVIFLAIGFETTIPATAVALIEAQKLQLKNLYFLSSHKIMPPAMEALIDEGVQISGYIAPGHVSTITGSEIYNPIANNYNLPVVISGFEPIDILQSILMLVKQIEIQKACVEIQYTRVVKPEGNIKAKKIMHEIFKPKDDWWRGLGILKNSGQSIKEKFQKFDAEIQIPVTPEKTIEPGGCICGEILKGLKKPAQCVLFAKQCTPSSPVGACMVSNEGACHAYFKYNRHE